MILVGFGRWKGFLPSRLPNNGNEAIGKTLLYLLCLNSEKSKITNWNINMGVELQQKKEMILWDL